jgi:hypothetical protein
MEKKMINTLAAAMLSALLPTSAHAAFITVQSTWAGPNQSTGLLTFTYDDTVADSNPSASFGEYRNAIVAASFLHNGTTTYTLAAGEPNSITLRPGDYNSPSYKSGSVNLSVEKDGVIYKLGTLSEEGWPAGDALSYLLTFKPGVTFLNENFGPMVNTTKPYAYTVVSSVPVPAGAWLFGSALLALGGTARRVKSRR